MLCAVAATATAMMQDNNTQKRIPREKKTMEKEKTGNVVQTIVDCCRSGKPDRNLRSTFFDYFLPLHE